MTLSIIVIGLLMLAASIWFLLYGRILRAQPSWEEDRHQLQLVCNRLLIQLNELDTESVDKGMDPVVAIDERRRLEAELAHVLRELEALEVSDRQAESADTPRFSRPRTLLVLSIVLPLSVLILYFANHHENLTQLAMVASGKNAQQAGGQGAFPPMVMEMVARLEQRLADSPDDPEGWTRLGRSYQVLGRFQEARTAYERAYRLAPDNVDIVTNYATALYNENQNMPGTEVEAVFNKLLKLNPNHPSALWVTGLTAYNRGDSGRAITQWEALLRLLPKDGSITAQVEHALMQVRMERNKK